MIPVAYFQIKALVRTPTRYMVIVSFNISHLYMILGAYTNITVGSSCCAYLDYGNLNIQKEVQMNLFLKEAMRILESRLRSGNK